MVNYCVPGCFNHSGKTEKTNFRVTYHKIPEKSHLQKGWLEHIRRTVVSHLKNCYVCSEHLTANSYEINFRSQIAGKKYKRRLKDDAELSEFNFRPAAKKPRLSSENRGRQRRQREVSVSPLS